MHAKCKTTNSACGTSCIPKVRLQATPFASAFRPVVPTRREAGSMPRSFSAVGQSPTTGLYQTAPARGLASPAPSSAPSQSPVKLSGNMPAVQNPKGPSSSLHNPTGHVPSLHPPATLVTSGQTPHGSLLSPGKPAPTSQPRQLSTSDSMESQGMSSGGPVNASQARQASPQPR